MGIARKYNVGGVGFEVVLEEPFKAMEYSPEVMQRILTARGGGIGLDIRPTRAGDDVPHRTLIQERSEVIPGQGRYALDLSQFEPFFADSNQSPAFRLTLCQGLENAPSLGKLITHLHDQDPFFSIYEDEDCPRYVLDENPETGEHAAILAMSRDFREGTLYVKEGMRSYGVVFELSTALMIMYTYNSAAHSRLLIHASIVRTDGPGGQARIFLGKSGTGKSTHSRLWLENIPGAELLNDDNPVLGIENGKVTVFGSPWSGKTPCYRNVKAQVCAVVRLEQAPENKISRIQGLEAYASIIASSSAIRWSHAIMDNIHATAEKVVLGTNFYKLECLPNLDAAWLCHKTIQTDICK